MPVNSIHKCTIKELIHEEFGDGIMSAIDFSMAIQRIADPKGDRVNVVSSGKFLSYKTYWVVCSVVSVTAFHKCMASVMRGGADFE